jgi:GTP-binding protein LepA
VEAQTLANLYLALEHNLEIIPVINKIDLPSADPERVKRQIQSDLGLDPDGALLVSAKEGIGIDALFTAIIKRLPAPAGDPDAPLRALIFDSHYDPYRGTVVYFRVFDGRVRPGDQITFMSNNAVHKVEEVGIFQLRRVPTADLSAGQVGYLTAGIKTISDTRCGDTITLKERLARPCRDSRRPNRSSSPPSTRWRPTITRNWRRPGKLLNDAAIVYEKDTSVALGFGFRCGFWACCTWRSSRTARTRIRPSLILTAPSVRYRLQMSDGLNHHRQPRLPDPTLIESTRSPSSAPPSSSRNSTWGR